MIKKIEAIIREEALDTVKDALRAICREVPPDVFREDVSSTALRKAEGR